MTTIAFDGRYLSIDSQVSCGDTTMKARKHYSALLPGGERAFVVGAGTVADIQTAIGALEGGGKPPPGDYTLVIASESGELCEWSDGSAMDMGGYDTYATGSGLQAALAAMRMGADATTAVAVAAEVDAWTGLPVVTFDTETFKVSRRKPKIPK